MFCIHCGTKLSDGAKFCGNCGASVVGISPPTVPSRSYTQIPAPPLAATASPAGVGGWLLFFCVALTILSPIGSLAQMGNSLKEGQPLFASYPAFENAIFIEVIGIFALVVYGIVAGSSIWRGSPAGKSIALKYLIVRLCAFIVIEVSAAAAMSSLPTAMFFAGVAGISTVIIREVTLFAIWFTYFKISKRVKNTYS